MWLFSVLTTEHISLFFGWNPLRATDDFAHPADVMRAQNPVICHEF